MSIWSSIGLGEPDVDALNNTTDAANYRGEGDHDVWIDVATTGFHHRLRLSITANDGPDLAEVLLDPENTRRLIDYLQRALPRMDEQAAIAAKRAEVGGG